DFAVAPRAVGERGTQEPATSIENRADLLVRHAAAVEIELVRLIDELHRSGAVATAPVVDRERHLEILEESSQVGTLEVVRDHPVETTPIHVRPLAILRGDHTVRKQARQLVQERDELVIVVRERHAAYAGERERDLRHLDRVVVNEHKRVEAEVESLREL